MLDATWSAATVRRDGPWLLREGAGGGKRVSAATAAGPVSAADIDRAEAAMHAMGQAPLFQVRGTDDAGLDTLLQARGYRIVDPVEFHVAPCAALVRSLPFLSVIPAWPPLAIECELWANAGIGPGRIAVMQRAAGPKVALLARHDDRPAGVAFVAIHGRIAMLHALEVPPRFRRQGIADKIMRGAANWAQDQGADWLSLVVTQANAPARALYASLTMQVVGQYHYRMR